MKKNDIDVMEVLVTFLLFTIVVGGLGLYSEIQTRRLLGKDNAKRKRQRLEQQYDQAICKDTIQWYDTVNNKSL